MNNANSNHSGDYSDANTVSAAIAERDRQTPTPSPFVSGSTPVKSLTGRFDKENLLADFESCADATALRQLVGEQMREIETLKSQVGGGGEGRDLWSYGYSLTNTNWEYFLF